MNILFNGKIINFTGLKIGKHSTLWIMLTKNAELFQECNKIDEEIFKTTEERDKRFTELEKTLTTCFF